MLNTIRPEKCLYHINNNLVSFCKCSSCYLPLCEICIRIHKNEHIMYETQPNFQKYFFLLNFCSIDDVIMQVHLQTKSHLRAIEEFKQSLNSIPPVLHLGSQKIKEQFLAEREKLISLFERLILSLQNSLIEVIKEQQSSLVFNIESLERQTDIVVKKLKEKVESFESSRSETRMDTIIKFYSIDERKIFQEHFERLQKRKAMLLEKKQQVDFGPMKEIGDFLRRILYKSGEGTYVNKKVDKQGTLSSKQFIRSGSYSTN